MAKKIDLDGLGHFKTKENASIAGTESTSTASKAYKVGEYFYYKGTLVICTADIASGGTITLNTNCKAQPLADSVCALQTAITQLESQSGYIANTIENVPIASFDDGTASAVKQIVVGIEPVQSGSGDPAPDNVRPITGWTGANVFGTGKNLLGGIDFANAIKAADSSAVINTTNKTVSYSAGDINNKVIAKKLFKPNTRYTIFCYTESSVSNLRIEYTDDTKTGIAIGVTITDAGKTVKQLIGNWNTGVTSLLYEQFGIFEGVLTENDFEAYKGHTYEIEFPDAAGTVYGATLENHGTDQWKLRVNYKSIDLGTLNWSKTSVFYVTVSDIQPLSNGWCSIFPVANTNQPAPSGINILIRGDTTIYVRNIAGTIYENMTQQEFATAMNGVQFVYRIAIPIEYTITAEAAKTLLGLNNIWADTGNINLLEYYADSKTYIDEGNALVKALIAKELPSMVANTALVKNDFRIVNNTLYRATTNIASGATLTVGTNVVATTLAEVIKPLLS